MVVVTVAALGGAGGEDVAGGVADGVLVAILVGALDRSRERTRGNQEGREGREAQAELLHRETPWATPR